MSLPGLERRAHPSLIYLDHIAPSKKQAKDECQPVDPKDHELCLPWKPLGFRTPLISITYLPKLLRIIRDDAVYFLSNAPSHHVFLVDRPHEHRPMGCSGIVKEGITGGSHEYLIQEVEGDVGNFEKLSSVGNTEADVGDGKARQISIAQWQVVGLKMGQDL